jgi:hypothetical protein
MKLIIQIPCLDEEEALPGAYVGRNAVWLVRG